MSEYEFSEHAYDMLIERGIKQEWVRLAIEDPELKEAKGDGTIHYIRSIEERAGRYLRVVVNPNVKPSRIITLFFDRRLGRAS